jgi:hypothetical protein
MLASEHDAARVKDSRAVPATRREKISALAES